MLYILLNYFYTCNAIGQSGYLCIPSYMVSYSHYCKTVSIHLAEFQQKLLSTPVHHRRQFFLLKKTEKANNEACIISHQKSYKKYVCSIPTENRCR